jgi:dynein heavy chain
LQVNVKAILRLSKTAPAEALEVMGQAKQVLDSWHATYLAVRERIEKSTDHRWEFDRRVLFERTDHMSAVIADLMHVVSVSSEFNKFFRGNELKAITNDPQALAGITRLVDRLTSPMLRLHYSIYDKSKHSKWKLEIATFDQKVAEIERRTEAFIERAFSQLRSSEGAFDLLQKFKHIEMRDSIRALLEANTTNIVQKARRELAATAALFDSNKANPPVYKNNPPVAGAIAWANALYLKQKRPIVRFKSMPSLFATPQGDALRREYLAFAKSTYT